MISSIHFFILVVSLNQITAHNRNENPNPGSIPPDIVKEKQVRFVNTTLDIQLQNFQNARVIDSGGSIYLLNGIDLFVINMKGRSEDGDNLKKIGSLGGLENQTISDIKASPWRGYTIFVADLDDFSNVYVVKHNEVAEVLVPIEKLSKEGAHCKVKLFHFNRELYCVIVNMAFSHKESSTMYFYKWRKSHFTRLEKVSTETANDLFAYTTDTFAIVVTVGYLASKSRHTALNVYTLSEDDELKHIQVFYLSAVNIFPIKLDDGFYFYSVSRSGRLSSYHWDNEKFVKLLDYKNLKNVTNLVSGQNLIIGQINNELLAYTNVTLSPGYEITHNVSKDFTKILVTKSDQRIYVAFFYQTSADALRITAMETEIEEVNEPILGESRRDAMGDCVTDIRDVQAKRVPFVEIIKNMLPLVYYKDRIENVDAKLHVQSLSVAKKLNIRRLNIDAGASLKQLKAGIDGIAAKLKMLRDRASRHKRSTVPTMDTVKVKRLNIPKELFDKILVKKNGTAAFKGKLTTKKLTAKTIKFAGASDPNVGTILPVEHKKVASIQKIQNLEVRSINGIDWNDFYSSLYLTDSPQPIEGNLIISKFIRVKYLDVTTVNGHPTSSLFTLSTNQEVSSNLVLSTFHCPTLDANLINGIDFGKTVALVNANNVIETPVKIWEAHIGNLTLANSDNDEFITKHIVGTRVEDLSQVYNGKVIIKGSLKLNNVVLDSSKTSMFIGDQRFGLNFADHFWMKSVDQNIGNVAWTSIITTPQIFASSINNIPAEKFVIVNVPPKESVNLVLQSAIVRGNVYGDSEFETTLTRINKECVRRGSSTVISGTKTFTGLLTVNDFTGEFVDNMATENFVLNNDAENKFYFDCTKQFESVTLNGNVEFGGTNLILEHWNGIDLLGFFQNAGRINQPTRLGSLRLTTVKATNVTVNQINGRLFSEIVTGLEASVGRKGNLNTVHINGNVNVGNLFVDIINEINFDNYLGLVVTSNTGGQIGGVKRFLNGLSVVNLFVRHVNSVDIGYWLENALLRNKDQVIGEKWALATASIGEMNAITINGLRIKDVIDVTTNIIEIHSNIRIQSLNVYRNLNGALACDVKDLVFILDNGLTKSNWNSVFVEGYVRWPVDEPSPINEILQFAVTGGDQIITGDIIFGNETFIDEIQSTGIINNVDVKNIFADCWVKSSKLQIVTGSKIFKEPVSVAGMISEKDLHATIINGVDVVQLNNSIFRIGDGNIVTGIKTFQQPLKTDRFNIEGSINGIHVNDIVFVNSTTVLPPIFIDKPISIRKDLTLADTLNGIPFDVLTTEIFRKAGPPQEIAGTITFQNLLVRGDTKVPFINNIDINDIVVKTSDSIQEIVDFKMVTGDLFIDGPVIITTMNGLDLVDAYSSSIFLDQDMVIRRLELANEVILHKGLTVNSQINGISIAPFIGWKPPTQGDLAPLWSNVGGIMGEADRLIHQNYGRAYHILYLDYASNIKLKFETLNSHPVSFIIDTVHSGELCGLDHRCDCPAQYDVSLGYQQIYINRRSFGDRQLKMIGANCNVTVRTSFINPCIADAPTQTVIEWSEFGAFGSLSINEPIFGVKLYEVGNEIFLLVNHANGSIIAMKYDQPANNWFVSDIISGSNIHMDILQWKTFKVLIVLSRPSVLKNHAIAALWFYNTDVGRHGFEMFQEIAGEYDLCTKLYMRQEDKFAMFLGKVGSQYVSIFVVHWGAQFQLFQTLALDSGVRTFTAFTVDDAHCLAVVTTNGYLYLYKYNNVEGWQQIVYGFFKDIESVMPFNHLHRTYLFVSMKNSATVLSVYSQGLH